MCGFVAPIPRLVLAMPDVDEPSAQGMGSRERRLLLPGLPAVHGSEWDEILILPIELEGDSIEA